MITVYKLTDANLQTRHGFQYAVGVEARPLAPIGGTRLCSPDVLHAYVSPEAAALMCPIHCTNDQRTLWRADTDAIVANDSTKVGVRTLTLHERVPLPPITAEQRVQIAIAMAWPRAGASWRVWARQWLSGADRSCATDAAAAAVDVACAASYYAATAAVEAAYASASSAADADADAAAADAAAAAAAAAAPFSLTDLIRTVLAEFPAETLACLETHP